MVGVQSRQRFAIELDDGRTFYCCGPGCMLRSWLHPEVYLGTGEATVVNVTCRSSGDRTGTNTGPSTVKTVNLSLADGVIGMSNRNSPDGSTWLINSCCHDSRPA